MTTPIEKPCDFGHFLRLNREAKGKTLEDISAITKIPVNRLRHLEEENLADLPPLVFLKGFVRAYAATVDADVDDALQRLDSCCAMAEADQPVPVEDMPKSASFFPRLLWTLVILAVLIILTLFVAKQFNTSDSPAPQGDSGSALSTELSAERPAERPGAVPEETQGTESTVGPDREDLPPGPEQPAIHELPEDIQPALSTPEPGTDETSAPDEASPPAAVPSVQTAEQVLQIEAIEPTWLTVSADDASPAEMTLKVGEKVTIKAVHHFKLLIGNAGGIVLTLNGQLIGVPGESKQVINLRLPRRP